MDAHHPLGPAFSRWVALTDWYASHILQARPGDEIDSDVLDTVAAELQQIGGTDTNQPH